MRTTRSNIRLAFALAIFLSSRLLAQNPYSKWPNGPDRGPSFFPIAVWLQDPRNAPRYKEIGINTYVGLWEGPTEKQIADLKQAGMNVICEQNAVALKHLDDKTIVGWMHGDEPDNAQELPDKSGYGPPIAPEKIIADYQRIQSRDPSRPVMLNLGQGVAWDGWFGRGVRTNHPEDYVEYLKGCDIASFDIYPVVHDRPEVAGKLWFVPQGVDRLRKWSNDEKIIWNCIECTRISNEKVKPTPKQVEAEVWMSLIHGSGGLIYFVHQFKPNFIEAALLQDDEMLKAVTKINQQIQSLAVILNSPTAFTAQVKSSNPDVPVDVMVRVLGGSMYVFAVTMRDGQTTATITLPPLRPSSTLRALGDNLVVPITSNELTLTFGPYEVKQYVIDSH